MPESGAAFPLHQVYRGVLLVVSHDRAFMDNSTDRLLVLKGDGLVRLFGGTYTEYLEMLEQEKFEAEAAQQEAARNRCGGAVQQFVMLFVGY